MRIVPAFVMRAAGPLIEWLIRRAKRTPYTHLPGYMNRWWLFRAGHSGRHGQSGEYPRFGIRIHEILRSDMDMNPHDHPWAFVTFILKGGYFERRWWPNGTTSLKWHPPGSLIFRRHTDWHMIIVDREEGLPVTMFTTGRWRHVWGFMTSEGKVDFKTYLQGYQVSSTPTALNDD